MPAVVRLGDVDTGHDACPPRPNNQVSPNVFVNGLGVHRLGDSYALHGCPDHPPHSAVAASGSRTVFMNGKACCRIGDAVSCGSAMETGSSNVFAGG